MFCMKCGTENLDHARFCQNCGQELSQNESPDTGEAPDDSAAAQAQAEGNGNEMQEQNRRRQFLIGGAVALVAIIICITALVLYNHQKADRYREKLNTADQYLQEMELEKAEAAYLDAIKIDPKQEEPYLQLADLYIKQGKKDEAVKILEQAEKKTSGEKAKKKLKLIRPAESDEDNTAYLEETLIPENQLADVGTFTDDGSNQLGLISAWNGDIDGDGEDEMITTTSEDHRITDMRITLYKKENGVVKKMDEIAPREIPEGTITYGDSTTEVFVKEHKGKYYLVVHRWGAGQGYSTAHTTLEVYTLDKKMKKDVTVETSWYRGDSSLTVNGSDVFAITDEEYADIGEKTLEKQIDQGVAAAQKELKTYGLEEKVALSQEAGLGADIYLKGYEPDKETEIGLSRRSRVQTGDYNSEEEHPVMEVTVEDFTGIRSSQSSGSDTTASAIKPGKLVQCLNERKSVIKKTFGGLSDSSVYGEGGTGFSFKTGYEGVYVYFPAAATSVDQKDICSGISGPASQLLEGLNDGVISVEAFERRSGLSLSSGGEGEYDYYGEFDDGTRIILYEIKESVTGDSVIQLLPPRDSL